MSEKSRPSTTATTVSRQTDSTLEAKTNRLGKGELLYTGPQGKRNHIVRRLSHSFIGIGTASSELTAEALYLQRPAKDTPFPNSKQTMPGSIGWGLPTTGDPRNWPLHMRICTEEELQKSKESFEIIFHRR
ncbi:hypothetical protein HOLleu_19749 [Holothuria leucospilota]|uniref:Uncharacterized protein n=1 Tax=Holothuria leucospilota TaxID=206669 RepID=A0A9Q1H7F5_HOLLE|nr:hypothetical protein HOLleu_19749 [Holothuria leucospilota]